MPVARSCMNAKTMSAVGILPEVLTVAAAGWGNQEIEQFRTRLRPAGWQVENVEGRLIVTRVRQGGVQ